MSKKETDGRKTVKKKHPVRNGIILGILAVCAILTAVFLHFGALKPAKSANVDEMKAYARDVGDISFPKDTRIIALGEATHGNAEFQQLKLDVFKIAVEKYGVRAFAIEGDFGCCEYVNRYIHGGEGDANQAAAAIGFTIYRTQDMADLIEYTRDYNQSAKDGDDIRFYGFDMQRLGYSHKYLLEECARLGVDAASIKDLVADDEWYGDYDYNERREAVSGIKTKLEAVEGEDTAQAIMFADVLLQGIRLGELYSAGTLAGNVAGMEQRDKLMAQNVKWISEQEEKRGFDCIFITAHNGHVVQSGSYDKDNKFMGSILADELGDAYYVIGTEFCRTKCSLPSGRGYKRTKQVFYSRDPLAVAAKKAGYEICWLDFSALPEDSELYAVANSYTYLGNLGENYSILYRVLPYSYREFKMPAAAYDSMIFVANAHPIEIFEAE